MDLFQILEGDCAVLREGGVFKQVPVATRRQGELYAKARGGFVRLYADGSTSLGGKAAIDALHVSASVYKDRLGRLSIRPGPERTPCEAPGNGGAA